MIEATKNLNNIKKVQNKKENMAKDSDDAVLHFEIWVGAGMKVDTYTGNLKLGKEASVAIVQVLLPGIDPRAKGKNHKTMVACDNWFGNLAGGTTWVGEMKSKDAKMYDNAPVPTSLF